MRLFILSLCLIPLLASGQDVLHLATGDSFQGKLVSVTAKQVEFTVIIDGPRGRGESRRRVPMKAVAFIDFEQSEAEAAIAERTRKADAETLRGLWVRHERHLSVANSPAGTYGLLLVEHWLADTETEEAGAALRLLDQIIASDWDTSRKAQAQQWRLKALVYTDQAKEAKEVALTLLKETTDPQVRVEARYILGLAAFEELRALVEAHPRWMEDDEILPKRDALFHETIDHFLYPSLFQGALRDSAASGLWQVCEVYQHAHMADKAKATAEDLIALYPKSKESDWAKSLVNDDLTKP